jgi:hypothetical protein
VYHQGVDPKPPPLPHTMPLLRRIMALRLQVTGLAMSEDETMQRADAVGTRPLLVEFKDSMHSIFGPVMGQVRCSAGCIYYRSVSIDSYV